VFHSSQVACLKGLEYGLRPVPHAHFGQYARYAVSYGAFRDCEPVADFPVAISARNQTENFNLATAECVGRFDAWKIASNVVTVVQQTLRPARSQITKPAQRRSPRASGLIFPILLRLAKYSDRRDCPKARFLRRADGPVCHCILLTSVGSSGL